MEGKKIFRFASMQKVTYPNERGRAMLGYVVQLVPHQGGVYRHEVLCQIPQQEIVDVLCNDEKTEILGILLQEKNHSESNLGKMIRFNEALIEYDEGAWQVILPS